MRRIAITGRGCIWLLIACGCAIALVPWQCMIWDGRFPNTECRLKFVDGAGNPVPGVALTVRTKDGTVCHFYPVDEFLPDQPLVSGADGQIVFHHTANYLEFGGHYCSNVFGMGFGEGEPRYECIFTHSGQEVFRTPYNFHHPEWNEFRKPTVTRQWSSPWDKKKHGPQQDEDSEAWERRLFGGKTRAEMGREERTAAGNFQSRFWREPKTQEITFAVVERTIVIPNP